MPRLLAEVVKRSPWGWRTGTVTSVSPDGWVLLACEDGQTTVPVHAWHHADLVTALPVGAAMRVHQRHEPGAGLVGVGPAALALPRGLVSLHVAQGPPPVPDPVDLEAWAQDDDAVVIDLRTRSPLMR